ncbi:hypothetical protein E1B28_007385 [Marasmius oreades]|uniref:Uncharacterized protein n=1 Tax=Marasmius oreades TaxID=181124 RepID=A0A9P7S1L1_9AGAR|nr:uncharacterized protein E1B28_007385 [Marasmius oreades]KAG7093734.1 hypothetical protein E1B28_007385 [Marasmius oreades]
MYSRPPFHWHSWYHHHRDAHRPSRLLWFLLGAGTATFVIFRKEAHRNSEANWGHCRKVPVQAPPQMQANLERERSIEPFQIPVPQHVQPRIPIDHTLPPSSTSTQTQTASPAGHSYPFQWGFQSFEQQRAQWEQDRERLLKKAHEAMSDMSETTLESLSGTIETLRAKLADHRAQREKQQKQLEQELEEKKKNSPRWV